MEFEKYVRTGSPNNIGSGTYGTVYTWYRKGETSVAYAGKLVKNRNWNANEVHNLKRCNHVNILAFVDIDINKKSRDVLLVTELLNSSLYDALRPSDESMYSQRRCGKGVHIVRKKFDPPLNKVEIDSIISGCFNGLLYLHGEEVMHRDISSANILLKVSSLARPRIIQAKYGDFGLAKLFNEERQPTTLLANAFYSAPEAGLGGSYDGFAADTYSLGVVIIEAIMTYSENWSKIESQYKDRRTFESVRKICFDTIRPLLSPNLFSLISTMVSLNQDRPIVDDMLYNRWLRCCSEDTNTPADDNESGTDAMEICVEDTTAAGTGTEINFEETAPFLLKVEELRRVLGPSFPDDELQGMARRHFKAKVAEVVEL